MSPISKAQVPNRAQATIEYLVVVAVVIIIGLVVVGLVSNFDQTTRTIKTSDTIQSMSQAISIVDSATDMDGNAIVGFQNNTGEVITITKINLSGEDKNYDKTLSIGERGFFLLDNLTFCVCLPGETTKRCSLTITYITASGLLKTQTLTQQITCSSGNGDNNGIIPPITDPYPVELDVLSPTVVLLSPINNDINKNSTIRFDFNATDNAIVTSCTLKLNNVDVNTKIYPSVTDYITYNFSILEDGLYDWNISCTDGTNTTTTSPRILNLDLNDYELSYCLELQDMNQHLDGNYILMNDINCYETRTWDNGKGFLPIGDYNYNNQTFFTGYFNGNAHTISGLYINRTDMIAVGMFGNVVGAHIEKVGLIDVNINCTYPLESYNTCGALVGNWSPSGEGSISSCFVTGTVTGKNYVGGLVGSGVVQLIENCYSKATVIGLSTVGGLAGTTDSLVLNCYASGFSKATNGIAGGLIGFNNQDYGVGEIENSFAAGPVSAPSRYGENWAGGLLSASWGLNKTTNCFWNTIFYPDEGPSSCIGDPEEACAGQEDVTYFQGTEISSKAPFVNNWTFGVDANWVEVEGDFPKLAWEN